MAGAEASSAFGYKEVKKEKEEGEEEKEPKQVDDRMDHFEKKGFSFAKKTRFIDEFERERFLG